MLCCRVFVVFDRVVVAETNDHKLADDVKYNMRLR